VRKTILLDLVIIVLTSSMLFSQRTYEGYLIKDTETNTLRYPIWVSMNEQSGSITASYFYKTVGTPIALQGERSGATITLRENNVKGKLAGTFGLNDLSDSLIGTWRAANGKKQLRAVLYPVDKSYERMSVIPKPQTLLIEGMRTFYQELQDQAEPNPCNEKGKMPEIEHWFARRGLAVLAYYWSVCGRGYAGYNHYVFDCSSGNAVALKDELDPSKVELFTKYVFPRVQEQVLRGWNENDEEGKQILIESMTSMDETPKPFDLDDYIRNSGFGIEIFSLTEKGLVLESQGIFELPQATRAFDVGYTVVVPYRDLKQFLKPGSILLRLSDL